MNLFDIRSVSSLEPHPTAKAYIGKAASFRWPDIDLDLIIVAPDDAGIERACNQFCIPVDPLLVQEVAVVSPHALLPKDDALDDGLSL